MYVIFDTVHYEKFDSEEKTAFREFEAPANSGASAMPPLVGLTQNTPSV